MKTKEQIRERFRVVECDGKYKVQVLMPRILRKPVWEDARVFTPFSLYGEIRIYENEVEAFALLGRLVNNIFAEQDDAWKPVQ